MLPCHPQKLISVSTDLFTESNKHHYHKTAQERINNDTLYEFLVDKFHYDIELYEWSKNMSVVRCSEISYDELEPTNSPSQELIQNDVNATKENLMDKDGNSTSTSDPSDAASHSSNVNMTYADLVKEDSNISESSSDDLNNNS